MLCLSSVAARRRSCFYFRFSLDLYIPFRHVRQSVPSRPTIIPHLLITSTVIPPQRNVSTGRLSRVQDNTVKVRGVSPRQKQHVILHIPANAGTGIHTQKRLRSGVWTTIPIAFSTSRECTAKRDSRRERTLNFLFNSFFAYAHTVHIQAKKAMVQKLYIFRSSLATFVCDFFILIS